MTSLFSQTKSTDFFFSPHWTPSILVSLLRLLGSQLLFLDCTTQSGAWFVVLSWPVILTLWIFMYFLSSWTSGFFSVTWAYRAPSVGCQHPCKDSLNSVGWIMSHEACIVNSEFSTSQRGKILDTESLQRSTSKIHVLRVYPVSLWR